MPDYTKKTIEFSISCGGTLINHFTILTAAHCILTSDTEELNNETITHLITPNEYYPTWYPQIILKNSYIFFNKNFRESMFTVTLGVHNLTAFEPSVKRSISKIIIV